MMLVYLACLLFGGSLLAASFFLGHHADGEFGFHDPTDLDAHGALDTHAELAADGHEPPSGEGLPAAIRFISLRNAIFFTAFFGLTGSTLTGLQIPSLLTFPSAVGMGLFAATLSTKLMRYLKRTEVGTTTQLSDLKGLTARVLIDLSRSRRGKIAVDTRGQTLQLLALTAEESSRDAYRSGETVVILRVDHGTAYVVEEQFLHL